MTAADTNTNGTKLELVDIWSRPGRWARQRAYIFLAVNSCVYGGLNVFIFWLRNAKILDFSWQSYASTYHKTLIDMMIFPLNVQDTPVLIPIVGMLLAVIIIVPILISQLFGFRYSIIFAAEVLLIGHLPVLSLFLVACSFIAGTSRHWLPFKFGVAILSLLPIAVYFHVATHDAPELQLKAIDPTLLNAPWLLAFLAAAGIAAAVLTLAKIFKYRPGGILLSMIPFFAIPGILFHYYIGADQLECRLLANRYRSDRWANRPSIDITQRVFREAVSRWQLYKIHDLQAIMELATEVFPTVAHQLAYDLRVRIILACEDFQHKYPRSRFVSNELYIQAMAEDLRFDHRLLSEDWRVKFHTDLVSPISAPLWQRLIDAFPDSIYAQPARLRLAILRIRKGQVASAETILHELMNRMPKPPGAQQTQPARTGGWRLVFAKPQHADIPLVDPTEIARKAEELLELIEHNADDPKFGNTPLAELLKLDRHHQDWGKNLLDLAIKYPGSKLHDNLIVMHTLTRSDPRALQQELRRHVKRFRGQDAGVLALFELAQVTRELALADMDEQADAQARDLYRRLIQEYPTHSLARQAAEELARLADLTQLTAE